MAAFAPGFLAGSAYGLAIDRDHARGHARHRSYPGDEAALKLLGVQSGEDVAEMIVRRRAVFERAEPTEQRELLGPEQRDLGEALRTGQHGEQAQKQDLIEADKSPCRAGEDPADR